ncbi:MAG: hypothetical protein ABI779_00010 [Acidobacteriota bacterium]
MSIREVIEVLNVMEADGVIERYAIGGAVGATFYLEPVATFDADVFIVLRPELGKLLVTLEPILDYLKSRGCSMKDEYVMIGDWPVQFLAPNSPLAEEALERAIEIDVEGESARVFQAEHLAAIALQTARAKDKARLLQFLEGGDLDLGRFHEILERHDLVDRWSRFERQFLKNTP